MSFGLCGLSRPFLARTISNRSKERRSLKLNMPGIQKQAAAGVIIENEGACGWSANVVLMIELRNKILTFRDILGLPPCDGSGPINKLVIGTIEDLRSLFPNLVPLIVTSETSIHQGLTHLNRALEQVLDLWTKVHHWIANLRHYVEQSLGNNIHSEQPGERALANLDFTIKVAKQVLHLKEQDRMVKEVSIQDSAIIGRTLINSHSDSGITFPDQASAPPASVSNSRPLLLPLRLEAVEKLNPLSLPALPEAFERGSGNLHQKDMKRKIDKIEAEEPQKPKCTAEEQATMGPRSSKAKLDTLELPKFSTDEMQEAGGLEVPPTPPPLSNLPASHPSKLCAKVNGLPPPPQILPTEGSSAPSPPPPPPPILAFKGSSTPAPTPPGPMGKGVAPPPPPPLGAAKTLRPKKTSTKLRRSTQMANLYRALKGRVEGSPLHGKQSQGRKSSVGGSTDGKQGMADALAEITKRSAYFRQIEEDVQKYANSLIEIKSSINSFETKDMVELLRFHKHVELCLEKLTDETQVLARFEDFPTKKLESLRTAAALYSKLEGILATLQDWKIVPPLNQLLDKVESYYNKIKGEIDTLERSKDEESKRFQSHRIQFDFNILERIKESMVDVSSSCMELALKERRDAAMSERNGSAKPDGQKKECIKILWRAFQLAFRVYSFAGGQDDRADTLSKELAKEIETHPQHP